MSNHTPTACPNCGGPLTDNKRQAVGRRIALGCLSIIEPLLRDEEKNEAYREFRRVALEELGRGSGQDQQPEPQGLSVPAAECHSC